MLRVANQSGGTVVVVQGAEDGGSAAAELQNGNCTATSVSGAEEPVAGDRPQQGQAPVSGAGQRHMERRHPARNRLCPRGSKQKYKKCCASASVQRRAAAAAASQQQAETGLRQLLI